MLSCGPQISPARTLATRPGHRGLRDALAFGLQRAVVVALGPDGAVLVDRLGRPRGVDVAARDEDEVAEVQRAGARDVGGLVAARVDGGVPRAPAQRRQVAGAVAEDVLGLGEEVGAVAAAVEERDLVAAAQGLGGDVAAEEDGAAEDEQAHDPQPISCACSRPRPRRSTLEGTMRRRRRPDLFRPDRGLQARMVLAAVSTPLIVLACAAAIVALAPLKIVGAFAIAAAIGIGGTITERRNRARGRAGLAGAGARAARDRRSPLRPRRRAQARDRHRARAPAQLVARRALAPARAPARDPRAARAAHARPSSRPSSGTSSRTSSTATRR